MGVIRRTSDIIAANVNDLVDYFEQPQRMLRQAVRDMEASLAATQAAVARSIGSEKLLAITRAEHLAQIDQWRGRAAAALAEGDERLARAAVARQIDRQRRVETVERQLAAAHEANETLRRQLLGLRDRHAAAQSQLALLTAQQSAAHAQREALTALTIPADRSAPGLASSVSGGRSSSPVPNRWHSWNWTDTKNGRSRRNSTIGPTSGQATRNWPG